jgi:NAD(P)-dependent dehydrogenase (short-subunit alcohol dehydrogenase family)
MKNIVIIGGSKGIGSAILLQQETNIVYNISRNAPEITPQPQTFSVDVLKKHFLKLKR